MEMAENMNISYRVSAVAKMIPLSPPPQRHAHVYSQNLEADITGKFAFEDVIKYWTLR